MNIKDNRSAKKAPGSDNYLHLPIFRYRDLILRKWREFIVLLFLMAIAISILIFTCLNLGRFQRLGHYYLILQKPAVQEYCKYYEESDTITHTLSVSQFADAFTMPTTSTVSVQSGPAYFRVPLSEYFIEDHQSLFFYGGGVELTIFPVHPVVPLLMSGEEFQKAMSYWPQEAPDDILEQGQEPLSYLQVFFMSKQTYKAYFMKLEKYAGRSLRVSDIYKINANGEYALITVAHDKYINGTSEPISTMRFGPKDQAYFVKVMASKFHFVPRDWGEIPEKEFGLEHSQYRDAHYAAFRYYAEILRTFESRGTMKDIDEYIEEIIKQNGWFKTEPPPMSIEDLPHNKAECNSGSKSDGPTDPFIFSNPFTTVQNNSVE